MLGGFGVVFLMGLGSTWGRFGADFRSWEGVGRFLGGSWTALGSPWSILIDFGSILKSVLGAQIAQNRPKIDAKMHSNRASVFGSILNRFLFDFGVQLGTILGSCWASSGGSATKQKTLKTQWFLMIFQGSGGRSWHHFLMFLV